MQPKKHIDWKNILLQKIIDQYVVLFFQLEKKSNPLNKKKLFSEAKLLIA